MISELLGLEEATNDIEKIKTTIKNFLMAFGVMALLLIAYSMSLSSTLELTNYCNKVCEEHGAGNIKWGGTMDSISYIDTGVKNETNIFTTVNAGNKS